MFMCVHAFFGQPTLIHWRRCMLSRSLYETTRLYFATCLRLTAMSRKGFRIHKWNACLADWPTGTNPVSKIQFANDETNLQCLHSRIHLTLTFYRGSSVIIRDTDAAASVFNRISSLKIFTSGYTKHINKHTDLSAMVFQDEFQSFPDTAVRSADW